MIGVSSCVVCSSIESGNEIEHISLPMMGVRTSFLFQLPAFEAFIEESNAKSDIHAHTLFINHSGNAVLNKDIGTVCTQAIAAV